MSAPVPIAKLTLSYPIYASDFDPTNSDFLFIGGGGGESRSGVKNKITLIDASKRRELNEIIDVELSTNEDSVQNLAVTQSVDDTAIVLAGINSSTTDQEKGINDHLRSFSLRYPTRRKRDRNGSTENDGKTPTIKALSKAALFKPSDAKVKETYQRILRLARPDATQAQVGVIATGLAPVGEVVVFDARDFRPDKRNIIDRIELGRGEEAADADVIALGDYDSLVTYCVNHEVFLLKVSTAAGAKRREPKLIYRTLEPIPATNSRLKFRFIRFLTSRLLIGLLNLPAWGGAELFLLEFDRHGASNGAVVLRKKLPKSMKAATTFALAHLQSPHEDGNLQHVIAIGGQDVSLTILTLDHNPRTLNNLKFRQHSIHRDLHPIQMTSLAFSTFTPPADPATAPPQYLKLVSTSMSSTVVVQTFPLIPYPSPVAKRKPADPPVRYTLIPPGASKGETPLGLSVLMAVIVVGSLAFLLQAFIEIRGATPEILGAKHWLPDPLREMIARPWIFDDPVVPTQSDVSKAYRVVKDSIPMDTEELKDAADQTIKQVKKTAGQMKHSAKHHHRKIRDLLSKRAEHLASRLTGEDDDDDDDDDVPLFSNSYEEPYSETDVNNPPSPNDQPRAIVINDVSDSGDHSLSTESHHSEEDLIKQGKARKWEELQRHEQKRWLRKLEDAGVWAVSEGETVLKGIFFNQLGGLVADAVRG